MKYAQDYLKDTASGETLGGFNSRVLGDSFLKTMEGIPQGNRWGERSGGWDMANKMINDGKIFSIIKTEKGNFEFKCCMDGNAWCCVGDGFNNLQISENYAFGDSRKEAITKFLEL